MNVKFQSSVLFVKDMNRSLWFYQEILGQEVKFNHGDINIGFDGFALWEKAYASTQVWGVAEAAKTNLALELYFETETLSKLSELLSKNQIKFVQQINEAPWGQLSFRIEDPDGNVVEVGEPLPVMVKRMVASGMSHQEIMQKSTLSIKVIEQMLIN